MRLKIEVHQHKKWWFASESRWAPSYASGKTRDEAIKRAKQGVFLNQFEQLEQGTRSHSTVKRIEFSIIRGREPEERSPTRSAKARRR